MAIKTIADLAREAGIIHDETDAGDNTASRVGTMFLDIIEYLGTLNTSSDSEDEGGSGGGGGGGVSLNEPLFSINNDLSRTPSRENQVLVYQNGTWTYGDYGGGSTTSGVTWNALAGNTSEQINLSHLTTALNSCSFWGRNPVNGVVSGDMINVGSITMKNGDYSVKIEVDQSGNLKFNGNIYATGGVSALGNSSSGGGGGGGSTVIWNQRVTSGTWIATVTIDGTSTDVYAPTSGGAGGATTLGGLNDVSLSSLDDGHYLRYNSSNSKWENGQFSSLITRLNEITGSYTGRYILSATNGTWSLTEYREQSGGISQISYSGTGNAVTSASVSGTTLTLTKGTTFLTSIPVASDTTLGGIKVGNHLTISNGKLSVNGTNLSVASATNAAQAERLSGNTSCKAWGQIYWQGGQPKNIDGIMTGVSTIKMDYGSGPNDIEMPNSSSIKIAPFAGTTTYESRTHVEVVLLNGNNQLSFGYGARLNNFQTDIQGGSSITFATSAVNGVGDSRREVGRFTKAGQFYVEQGTQGIRIGNGVIKWDSKNNSLYVERAADAGGGVANFYATGGVSALGFSNGSTGSVTVADLIVENLAVDRITPNNGDEVYLGNEDCTTYIDVNGDIEVQNALSTDTHNGFTWVPMLKLGTKASTYTPSNSVCSLYVKKVNSVNKLYFYNGSSETQIA